MKSSSRKSGKGAVILLSALIALSIPGCTSSGSNAAEPADNTSNVENTASTEAAVPADDSNVAGENVDEDQVVAESEDPSTTNEVKTEDAASDSTQEETEGTNTQSQKGEDIPIIINGAEIQLGMTVQEIVDATGLPIAEKGKTVKVNSEEDVNLDTGNILNSLQLHVTNYNSYSAKDVKDCIATQVIYTVISSKEKDELLSFAGITIGDTEEDVVKALGEPLNVYESDSVDYKDLSYKFNNRLVIFTLMDGKRISTISVSLTIS